jgi:hypothetical protein
MAVSIYDHRVAGCPFVAAGRSSSLENTQEVLRRIHPELIQAIRHKETRLGRPMSTGDIDAFARGYHAEDYRLDMRRLMAWGVVEPNEEN